MKTYFNQARSHVIAVSRMLVAFVFFLFIAFIAYCLIMILGRAFDKAWTEWFEQPKGMGFVLIGALVFALAIVWPLIRVRRTVRPRIIQEESSSVPEVMRIIEGEERR